MSCMQRLSRVTLVPSRCGDAMLSTRGTSRTGTTARCAVVCLPGCPRTAGTGGPGRPRLRSLLSDPTRGGTLIALGHRSHWRARRGDDPGRSQAGAGVSHTHLIIKSVTSSIDGYVKPPAALAGRRYDHPVGCAGRRGKGRPLGTPLASLLRKTGVSLQKQIGLGAPARQP